MPKICYINREFRGDALDIIRQANSIIHEYQRGGYDLTLRQLYYQFVSKDAIVNKDSEYKRLGSIINDARLAGMVDWNAITDRGRQPNGGGGWDSPAQAMEGIADCYSIDRWIMQPLRIEVWVEKEALAGVLSRACNPENVTYFSCKGYTSASAMWEAAQRLGDYIEGGQRVRILHLGDHDPSGLDMTRDIRERLAMFLAIDQGRAFPGYTPEEYVDEMIDVFTVDRIALNMDQIRRYAPPPNPAKITDSRASSYIERYGSSSWELDALDPATLVELIRSEVASERDDVEWETAKAQEANEKGALTAITKNWSDVQTFLTERGLIEPTLIAPDDDQFDDE